MLVATLVTQSAEDVRADAEALLAQAGGKIVGSRELGASAIDVKVDGLDTANARDALGPLEIIADIFVQRAEFRQKKLFVADMDSTMIAIECIDELADFAGLKAEVAAVTERAMRGELDFEAALKGRVALLEGMAEAVLDRCYRERVVLTPGADTLIATLSAQGVRTVLVSGGFTFFTGRVADRLGFDRHVANVLRLSDGVLAGTVEDPVVDAATKEATLRAEADALGIGLEQVIAIGDGANDIPMIRAAGLGVAYHAKPKAAEAADARIAHGDLTTLLYGLGIPRSDWVQ